MSENYCLMKDVVPGDIVYCGGGSSLSPGPMKAGLIVAIQHINDRVHYTVVISPTMQVASESLLGDTSIIRVYHDNASDILDTCK
jgi:hypothetical protein